MKKRDLAMLALIGISTGLCSCQGKNKNTTKMAVKEMGSDMRAFYNSLSAETKKKFLELDTEHRKMASEMAFQNCGGSSCGSHTNTKSSGSNAKKMPQKNADHAVDVQYQSQMKQRQKMNSQMQGTQKTPNSSSY